MASSKDNPSSISRASRLTRAIHAARKGAPQTPHRDVVSGKVLETKPAQRAIKYPKGGDALRQHVNEAQKTCERPMGPPPSDTGPPPERVTIPRSIHRAEARAGARRAGRPAAPGRGKPDAAGIFASPADLGQIVRRTREQRRTTQAQLALAAGAGRRFISELESGKPTLELGKVLGVMKALGLRLNVMAAPDES